MEKEDALSILINGEYGILSIVDKDNLPYGIPLNYAVIEDSIFFHCAHEGRKIENLSSRPEVSFCVVGKTKIMPEKFTTNYESVIVYGRASIAYGDEKFQGLTGLLQKYSPDQMDKGKDYMLKSLEKTTVIKISIDHLTGKADGIK